MFEGRTREVIKAEMLEDLSESSGLTALEGGFADQCVGPVSVQFEKAYMSMDAVLELFMVSADSGWLIDLAAGNFSIVRKDGVKATAQVTFHGATGALVEEGALFATQSGLIYALTEAVALDGTGTGQGVVVALEAGERYNVPTGAIDRMFVNPLGVETFDVGAATGGVDVEGDAPLVGRYYDHLQRPSTSGNANDYRKWALEVPGAGETKVISTAYGPGTVGITLVNENFGPVDDTVVGTVLMHIQGKRPVGMDQLPVIKSATTTAINIVAVCELDTSVTADMVASKLKAALGDYCKSLVEAKYAQDYDGPEEDMDYILSYNRVATLLMTIPGVRDYTSLTINGGEADVVIGKDAVPVVGTVSVT